MLLVRSDNFGDVLLAGPAVRAVAAQASLVTMLVGPYGRAAASLLPGIHETYEFRAPWIDPADHPVVRSDIEALTDYVQHRPVDEAIILTSHHQSPLPMALVLRLAGVRTIAAISPEFPGSLLDVRHHVDDDVHEVERNLSLVATLGYELSPDDDGRLQLRPGVTDHPVDGLPARYVVVHPGASVPARGVPCTRAAAIVDALTAWGHRVVVTGSSRERRMTGVVAGSAGIDLGGRTTLEQLATVLAGASVVVCGNTGTAHLAAAVGTPVVSIFAPTVPASRWRPWKVPHVVLGDQHIGCAGCRARTCPIADQPCIDVAVPDVVDAVAGLAEGVERVEAPA